MSQTNSLSFRTRLNDIRTSVTSSHLIKFPAITKNYQQVNLKPKQQNTFITNYSTLPEIKPKIHDKLTTMTTLTTFPHSFHQPYLPNLHNHINHILTEIDKIDKPIMPHEVEDDDQMFAAITAATITWRLDFANVSPGSHHDHHSPWFGQRDPSGCRLIPWESATACRKLPHHHQP